MLPSTGVSVCCILRRGFCTQRRNEVRVWCRGQLPVLSLARLEFDSRCGSSLAFCRASEKQAVPRNNYRRLHIPSPKPKNIYIFIVV